MTNAREHNRGRLGWMPGLVGVALFLLVLEIALRWLFPLGDLGGLDRARYSPVAGESRTTAADATLAHRSLLWRSAPDRAESIHRLNLYGFRDREWRSSPPLGKRRVLIVGDSMVEGILAGPNETIPSEFERTARSIGESVEVLNLGVAAAGIEEYGRLLLDAAPALEPALVVLVLYANDFRTVAPTDSWQRTEIGRRTFALRLPQLLRSIVRGESVARRWIESPVPFLVGVPDSRNPWSDPKFAARHSRWVEPALAEAMRSGDFNPHLADFGRRFESLLQNPADLSSALAAITRALTAIDAELRLVYLPSKLQVHDRYLEPVSRYSGEPLVSLLGEEYQAQARAAERWAADLELPFFDLTSELRRAEASGTELFWEFDDHMRPAGYRFVGERLARWCFGSQLPTAEELAGR